jgi:hypothetical protein
MRLPRICVLCPSPTGISSKFHSSPKLISTTILASGIGIRSLNGTTTCFVQNPLIQSCYGRAIPSKKKRTDLW